MILYLEKQLEDAYNVYRKHQIKKDMSFLKLEDFRECFEEIMDIVYREIEEEDESDRF
jgi:hypothetical protein